jgi:hypothetical protein
MKDFRTKKLLFALNVIPSIGIDLYHCDMCSANFHLRMGHVFDLHCERVANDRC